MIPVYEFGKVMAYMAAATQKPVTPETVEVYYDLLGDLPLEALQSAVKNVVLTHKYATFPSVAEIREAAVNAMSGKNSTMPAQEAWSIAWRAAGKIDPDIVGEFITFDANGNQVKYASMTAYALADVPSHVVVSMQTFGLARLIAGKEPIGVMQAQFCQTYTALQLTAKRDALLPASLRAEIDRIGNRPKQVADALAKIGVEK